MALSASTLSPSSPSTEGLKIAPLVEILIRQHWPRLRAEYDHPLNVLYQSEEQPLRQWTMGWGVPGSENPLGALYLLIWQADRFQNATWQLYQDGVLLLETPDDPTSASRHCRTLLEGEHLPVLEPLDLLRRLTEYQIAPDLRERAADLLGVAMAAFPFIFEHFRPALLTLLAEDLDNPHWPTLDILKLHRLSQKTVLVRLLKDGLERGQPMPPQERQRLNHLLEQLRWQYDLLGHELHPLFLPAYGEEYQRFRALLTDGVWRIRLAKASKRSQDSKPTVGFIG